MKDLINEAINIGFKPVSNDTKWYQESKLIDGATSELFEYLWLVEFHLFLIDNHGIYIQITKHFTCYAFVILLYDEFEDENKIIIDEYHADYISYKEALYEGIKAYFEFKNKKD